MKVMLACIILLVGTTKASKPKLSRNFEAEDNWLPTLTQPTSTRWKDVLDHADDTVLSRLLIGSDYTSPLSNAVGVSYPSPLLKLTHPLVQSISRRIGTKSLYGTDDDMKSSSVKRRGYFCDTTRITLQTIIEYLTTGRICGFRVTLVRFSMGR